jgi:DNA-binding MarR family transcriptional regulator
MTLDPSNSAGFLANHMARLFAQHLNAALAPLGLGTGSFPALLELWRKDGRTQRELAETLCIEQATMANTLIRMQRDGLITRAPNPADGRSQVIGLTDKARRLEAPAKAAAGQINTLALEGMAPEQRADFLDVIRGVIARLQDAPR